MPDFTSLGVQPRTLRHLTQGGIVVPQPVQREAIPPLLQGRDAVIAAPTGSGKTLAFLVPLVERLQGSRPGGARALIVTPTRELATQVGAVLATLDPQLRRALVFGGVGYGPQIDALRRADVVVGCPGRIVDLAGQKVVNFSRVEYLVLDEADEMLDAGFAPDVERIIALTPQPGAQPRRQSVLASATMPEWVERMIARHLVEPVRIAVTAASAPDIEHGVLHLTRETKVDALSRLLKSHRCPAIVFHRTKHGAKKLARDLARLGHLTAELQGNLSQNARDRAIGSFRRQEATVLVATNVAARGLDISHVGLVINFELPETPQWLTHRVGRTARNGASGRALTFLTDEDGDQWRKLRRLGAPPLQAVDLDQLLEGGEMRFRELPPTLAGSPHHSSHPSGRHRSGPGQASRRRRRPLGNGASSARPAGRG